MHKGDAHVDLCYSPCSHWSWDSLKLIPLLEHQEKPHTRLLAANVTIETPPGLEVLAALCCVSHTSTGSSGVGRGRAVWQEIIQADASPCVPEIESKMLNQLNRFRSASAVIMKGGRG